MTTFEKHIDVTVEVNPFEMGEQFMLEWDNTEQLQFFLGMWSGMQELGPYAHNQILAIADEAFAQDKSYEIRRVADILRQYFLKEV